MILSDVTFKRKFSFSAYKNHKILMSEMTFTKDFVTDKRGDLYPILYKSDDCQESVVYNRYHLHGGSIKRWTAQFFPYSTYEMTAHTPNGKSGFCFSIPNGQTEILTDGQKLYINTASKSISACDEISVPDWVNDTWTMLISCRPGAFDIFFKRNEQPIFFHSFLTEIFDNSSHQDVFMNGAVAVSAEGTAVLYAVSSYVDCGGSQADMRAIRYENGQVMLEQGKIYLTMSIRIQEKYFQAIFSWVPGTAQLEMTGALFFDSGDGNWCGDISSSILYHRQWRKWLLWVVSFNHDHVLGHASFEGDPRFGVNVIDIELMEQAPAGTPITTFTGILHDEDPDFFYDEAQDKWFMAICRLDPSIDNRYRYIFFESSSPFEGYKYIGQSLEGTETGGSFVKIKGEQLFVCGNDFALTSNYRIYSKDGMENAKFDLPDGGFRGWGTLIPVPQGSRIRYYWITFDRHNHSDYKWSYGNLYCFEAILP